MKKIIFLILIFFFTTSLYASRPLIGIAGISSSSPRSRAIAQMIEIHLLNIVKTSGGFDIINSKLLNEELRKFRCLEEKCLLRFARDAKISLIIKGELVDKGDYLDLALNIYGSDIPYNGKKILLYKVYIPMKGRLSRREYSYISEEHSGKFISKFFSKYRMPLFVKESGANYVIEYVDLINGAYDLYRYGNELKNNKFKHYKKIGTVKVSRNKILNADNIKPGDFIFLNFTEKSIFFEEFYYGRKKEIVIEEPSINSTLYKVLFTVPASASMPLAAPILGYYHNSDWNGLALWAINASPYLYLEYTGFFNPPENSRSRNENITRDEIARNRFAYYMFFTGGLSLFVDAFSHQYLDDASNYLGTQPLMGNSYSAAYLALVSGGGGHFYRGDRLWGYFYFHLNNILLYLTIREFSPGEKYDASTGSYSKESVNRERGYLLAGIYGAAKIVEIIHAVFMKDRISNGKVIEEEYVFAPRLHLNEDMTMNYGIQFTFRFN